MSHEDFLDLVRRMRSAQIRCAENKNPQARREQLDLERRVDAAIASHKKEEGNLFDRGKE